LRATKDEKGGAQWSMINGQFSMGERHATRITQYATRATSGRLTNFICALVVHFGRERKNRAFDLGK